VWLCRAVLGTRIQIGAAESDGRVRIEIRGHSLQSLAGEIAGLGARLEIIDPPELREELARIGAELTASYRPSRLRS
jgi:predicted DNA-binding transcriptional regulator YafY